jgi:hypothetical protein
MNWCTSVSNDGSVGHWDVLSDDDGAALFTIPGISLLTAVDIIGADENGIKIVASSFEGSLPFSDMSKTRDGTIAFNNLMNTPNYKPVAS